MKITIADIEKQERLRKYNKIIYMFPEAGVFSRDKYPRHIEFFNGGGNYRERLFIAANRVGKSESGAYECTLHLTGLYPEWWVGKKFNKTVNVLAAGETGKLVRDSVQKKFLGDIGAVGTGMIPADLIGDRLPRAGIKDAVDIVLVKHISGGWSTLQFQSYDQGREAFQATERDVVWMDEEPPIEIYTEALTRTMTTKGIVMTTFTPLKGMSDTVMFLQKQAIDNKILSVTATWDDAGHLGEEDKKQMLDAFPPHQRDARAKGIPSMGSGVVYPVVESDYTIEPFELPNYMQHAYGMDVGWNNTAVVYGAYDGDADTWYIWSEYKKGQVEPAVHVSAIKNRAKGHGYPGVIDPASKGRSQADGTQLLKLYRDLGLNLTEADNGVESGIYTVWERLSTGRIKIFNTCVGLLAEMRVYRRDERGRIVKKDDHLVDALRYLIVSGDEVMKTDAPKRKKSGSGSMMNSLTGWMAR